MSEEIKLISFAASASVCVAGALLFIWLFTRSFMRMKHKEKQEHLRKIIEISEGE